MIPILCNNQQKEDYRYNFKWSNFNDLIILFDLLRHDDKILTRWERIN